MKIFFRIPLKVAVSSVAATVILYGVIIGGPLSRAFTASTFGSLIQITVPILIFITILGFIYSFFIKGNQKFIFLLFHFISICIISLGIYVSIALRDFAP
ncbi:MULTISPECIES: hypothetical protein [Priestia]|uniref:hypothetical protein n=1 Tax=Priestia TaxID=2800373 RepID=UPI001C8DC3B1|nr:MULTISPECIES: hypothetical protein [Priestia]MBX9987290.1 hypothetical protein [Priestia aryabhattai]MBX9998837.1 hypothetical protein [Priestia aryabhattai]MCU7741409.1 hypothetical protein [Priestia megaterium]MDG0060105.1 hypothetical protein [Priestia sp. P5]UYV54728.1 hypothetical protein OHU65_09155 [Priestia megaterium]